MKPQLWWKLSRVTLMMTWWTHRRMVPIIVSVFHLPNLVFKSIQWSNCPLRTQAWWERAWSLAFHLWRAILDRLCLACWTGKSSGWVWSWWRWSSCCCGMVTSDAVVKLQTFWCKLSSISVLVNLFLIRSSTLHYWILKLGVFYYQYKLRLMAEWIQHCTRTTY